MCRLPIVFGDPSKEQWPFLGRQAGGCCASLGILKGEPQQPGRQGLGNVDGSFSECLFVKGGLPATVPLVSDMLGSHSEGAVDLTANGLCFTCTWFTGLLQVLASTGDVL